METLSGKLREYSKNGAYPFHMPGHKRQLKGAYQYDITEIEGFDNLNNPSGIIREMNEDIARHYGSRASFFTVNGSTCGNLAAVSAVADIGDTVIIARNCHKSVMNAAILRKLSVEYIFPEMYNDALIGAVTVFSIKTAVDKLAEKGTTPKAVVITSPTYEGVVSDIVGISEYLHLQNIPLIVDSAHGAHLHFDDAFPRDCVEHIDICIMSAHKTLPVLNQGAIVHVNSDLVDMGNVQRYLSMYQTSSPSYVIMESMSYALELIDEKSRIEEYVANLRGFYEKVADLRALSVEPVSDDRDMGKLVIYTGGYMSGSELGKLLRKRYRLEPEMCGASCVLCMTSMMDTAEAFDRLAEALADIDGEILTHITLDDRADDVVGQAGGACGVSGQADSAVDVVGQADKVAGDREVVGSSQPSPIREHIKKYEPYEVFSDDLYGKCVYKPIDECVGEVAYDMITTYPPGIPLVMPGEVIEREDISYVKRNCSDVEYASVYVS